MRRCQQVMMLNEEETTNIIYHRTLLVEIGLSSNRLHGHAVE